jgi:hypothetical protein
VSRLLVATNNLRAEGLGKFGDVVSFDNLPTVLQNVQLASEYDALEVHIA